MLVEFIGCTGSGKTTLLHGVEQRLRGTLPVMTAADFVCGLAGLGRVAHPTLQNVAQEVIGLPFFLQSLYPHRGFIAETVRLALRPMRPWIRCAHALRSIERKLAVDRLCRRADRQVILVDEGPILTAHMFVRGASVPDGDSIAAFVDTLPLPDVVVAVEANRETIVRRTLQRGDAPRDIRRASEREIVRHIDAATSLFSRLVPLLQTRCPVLVVNTSDDALRDVMVEHITQFIASRMPAHLVPQPNAVETC